MQTSTSVETPIINQSGNLNIIDAATGDRRIIGHVEQADGKWLAVPADSHKPRSFKTHSSACDYLCRLAWGW